MCSKLIVLEGRTRCGGKMRLKRVMKRTMLAFVLLVVLVPICKADEMGRIYLIYNTAPYAGDPYPTLNYWLDAYPDPLEAQGGMITLDGSPITTGEAQISATGSGADVLTFYEWESSYSFTLPTVLTQALNDTNREDQYAIYYNAPVEVGPGAPGFHAEPIAAPEPSTLPLLASGLGAVLFMFMELEIGRKRQRK